MSMKLLGITNVDFDVIGQQLIDLHPSDSGEKVVV
jgi:hypothetical protein